MRVAYLDARPRRENERIQARLKKYGIVNGGGVWSHVLVEEALRGIASTDYFNAWDEPRLPSGYDAYIIGGRGKSNSSYDSLCEFRTWMRDFVNEIRSNIGKKRIVGICFGHQLVSLAAGLGVGELKRRVGDVQEYAVFGNYVALPHAHRRFVMPYKGVGGWPVSIYVHDWVVQAVRIPSDNDAYGFQGHIDYGATRMGLKAYCVLHLRDAEKIRGVMENAERICESSMLLFRMALGLGSNRK